MPALVSSNTVREFWWHRRLKFCLDNPGVKIDEVNWIGDQFISFKSLRTEEIYYSFFESCYARDEEVKDLEKRGYKIIVAGTDLHINKWELGPRCFDNEWVTRYRAALKTRSDS